eukprot:11476707-Alexandrium_andersonii.AAC.1
MAAWRDPARPRSASGEASAPRSFHPKASVLLRSVSGMRQRMPLRACLYAGIGQLRIHWAASP